MSNFVVSSEGEFVSNDDETRKSTSMVVARILVKTKEHKVVNIVVNVNIGGDVFSIKLEEDRYGSLQWIKSCKKNHEEAKLESRNSAGEDEDSNFPIEDVEESRAAMFNTPSVPYCKQKNKNHTY
ncbi:hypothetical protein P8452_61067 [Trifolium repens]|nr:hypothetical protein P8452_61067 [Trifolium repens]